MTFTLRPYQEKFVTDIRREVIKHKSIVACAATGAGKSKIFISIALKAMAKGSTVLILAESTLIHTQISAELGDYCLEIKAGNKFDTIYRKRCYVAMAQTLRSRQKLIEFFHHLDKNLVLIIDEGHVKTPFPIAEKLPNAYTIVFTATPEGEHLIQRCNHLVIGPQPAELVSMGFLTPCVQKARQAIDGKTLEIKNGEYTEVSQQHAFETKKVFDGLTEDLYKIKYRKAIIYCSSIKHCNTVNDVLRLCGFNTAVFHSEQDKLTRKKEWDRFTKTDWVNIIVSVSTLTKGIDFPAVDLIVLLRATTSLSLYLQMCGRCSRVLPEEMALPKGDRILKPYSTVLDYGENWKRLGRWIDFRDWDSIWKDVKKKKGGGVAPVKLCPQCESIINAVATECEFCGFIFVKEVKTPPPSQLVDITCTWIGKRLSQMDARELAEYAMQRDQRKTALRVAKANEQKTPKFLKAYGAAMGYKPTWYYVATRDMKPEDEPILYRDVIIT